MMATNRIAGDSGAIRLPKGSRRGGEAILAGSVKSGYGRRPKPQKYMTDASVMRPTPGLNPFLQVQNQLCDKG